MVKVLSYQFRNNVLFENAIIHPSYRGNQKKKTDNRALETFGDMLLKLLQTRYLTNQYRKLSKGALTRKRQKIETNQYLWKYIQILELNKQVKVAHYISSDSKKLEKALSKTFEALVAAIFIDSEYNWSLLENWYQELLTYPISKN